MYCSRKSLITLVLVDDNVDLEVEEAEVSTLLGMAISADGIDDAPIPPPLPEGPATQTLAQRVLEWQGHLSQDFDTMSEAAHSVLTISSATTSMRSDDLCHLYPPRPENWVTVELEQIVLEVASY